MSEDWNCITSMFLKRSDIYFVFGYEYVCFIRVCYDCYLEFFWTRSGSSFFWRRQVGNPGLVCFIGWMIIMMFYE